VEGLLGGNKEKPVPMEGLPAGFMIQEDNVAAEFNIPPARTAEEFTKAIYESVKYLSKIAQKNNCKLAFKPELDFPKAQLQTKHCMTFGCNPDFNIWALEENPTPPAPETMRTAAGHIHLGWSQPSFEQAKLVGRMFDLYVTTPSILFTEPNRRRQVYGKAGACRLKSYGIECRSVDNFWLGTQALTKKIYSNIMFMFSTMNTTHHEKLSDTLADFSDMIQDAINNHKKDVAQFLVDKFGIPTF
jgi:hypothetical protein